MTLPPAGTPARAIPPDQLALSYDPESRTITAEAPGFRETQPVHITPREWAEAIDRKWREVFGCAVSRSNLLQGLNGIRTHSRAGTFAARVTVPTPSERPRDLTDPAGEGAGASEGTARSDAPAAVPPASTGPELVTRCAAEIAEREVEWLWPGRIPLGMVSIIDGDPGLGKSMISLSLAAAVSRGRPIVAGAPVVGPAAALILALEDSAEHTITPRLRAAGADMKLVHIVEGARRGEGTDRAVSLPDDAGLVRAAILRYGAKLVVIDPIKDYLSGAIDAHNDQSTRGALVALKRVALDTGAAVVLLRHLNKKSGEAALYRGGGSIAFGAVARSSMVVGRVPDTADTCALAVAKCNLAPPCPAVAYRVETDGGRPYVVWGEELEISADDLLPAAPVRATKRVTAADWLRELLAGGPLAAEAVFARGKEQGFSERTLRRAADEIGVSKERAGVQHGSRWCLPAISGQRPLPGEVGRSAESSEKREEGSSPANSHPGGELAGEEGPPLFPNPRWRDSLPPDGRGD
jgi:hypothetical protein